MLIRIVKIRENCHFFETGIYVHITQTALSTHELIHGDMWSCDVRIALKRTVKDPTPVQSFYMGGHSNLVEASQRSP